MQSIEVGLSLWNPWAFLLAIGAKKIETRSWDTRHRGWVAICSTQKSPPWTRDCHLNEDFAAAVKMAGFALPRSMPDGACLAVGRLVETFCVGLNAGRYKQRNGVWTPASNGRYFELPPPFPERAFGDYGVGRFGWRFDRVIQLRDALPCNGGQRLWKVDADLQRRIIERLAEPLPLEAA